MTRRSGGRIPLRTAHSELKIPLIAVVVVFVILIYGCANQAYAQENENEGVDPVLVNVDTYAIGETTINLNCLSDVLAGETQMFCNEGIGSIEGVEEYTFAGTGLVRRLDKAIVLYLGTSEIPDNTLCYPTLAVRPDGALLLRINCGGQDVVLTSWIFLGKVIPLKP